MLTGRHILIVSAFAVIAVGQTLFGLGTHTDELEGWLYVLGTANAATMVGLAYFNLYALVTRLMLKGRYVEYFTILLGVIFIYIVGKWIVEEWLLRTIGIERMFNFVTVMDWLSNGAMSMIFMVSVLAMKFFRQWIRDTQKISELENPVDEFKNRIDAPLLYRVLGYAARKVKTDPQKVSEMIYRLSERLRRDLYEGKR
jgi:hypothetical protein